jgi:hypothetical protein
MIKKYSANFMSVYHKIYNFNASKHLSLRCHLRGQGFVPVSVAVVYIPIEGSALWYSLEFILLVYAEAHGYS